VRVDVLHANHHGADNASDGAFLGMIEPEVVVISAGNGNGHKHPNHNALKRMADAGVTRIFQTEWGTTTGTIPAKVRERQAIAQGDVVLETDGESYEVSTSQSFAVDE